MLRPNGSRADLLERTRRPLTSLSFKNPTMPQSSIRKRRHHYVWKHYLRAWAHDEKIFTRLRGKLLEEKLDCVAQERDFYELQMLTSEDIQFVRWFVVETAMPHLRKIHEDALKSYLQAQYAVIAGRKFSTGAPEVGQAADALASNFTENWHASLEGDAASHLDELRGGSVAFYDDANSCIEFNLFLATQYFRTKAAKEVAIASLGTFAGSANSIRMWGLLAHMFANNVAWSLFSERKENGPRLLKNETNVEFITSDQPVVNIAAEEQHGQAPEQMTLYYPLAPHIAVIVGNQLSGRKLPETLREADVSYLNKRVANQALLRVFARKKEGLVGAGES